MKTRPPEVWAAAAPQCFCAYAETITAAEARRQNMSNIYVSLAAAFIVSLGFFKDIDLLFPTVAAVVLSSLWLAQLRYFQDLAKAKWQIVLQAEENRKPRYFTEEYAALAQIRSTR